MTQPSLRPTWEPSLTFGAVQQARGIIGSAVTRTPLIHSHALSRLFGGKVYLKPEMLQHTGSFKVRGALNKIAHLAPGELSHGVITASAGNHAQGVAVAAAEAGVRAVVVMPESAPHAKVAAAKGYGAEVLLEGRSYKEAQDVAIRLASEWHLVPIPAFDDPDVIAGQGTIGLEILEDLPEVDEVLVPVGGGGLIAGIALAVKTLNPGVRVVGVQAQSAPSLARSLAEGAPVTVPPIATLADGIAIERPGELPFKVIREYVDDCILVSEASIREAIIMLLERCRLVAEGAGAVCVASRVEARSSLNGKRVVFVLSGGNIDLDRLKEVLAKSPLSRS